MTTYQHLIDRGPYKGMVETLTDNPHPSKTARCYMCAEPLKASTSWMSLVGDHQDGVFTARFLCPLCARERLNGSRTKRSAAGTTPKPPNQGPGLPKSSLT